MKQDCQRCGRGGLGVEQCQSRRGETEEYHGYRPGQLCRRCHIDIIPDPEVLYPQLLEEEFNLFYAAASGTSRKVLKTIEESHVLVSYLTRNNGRLGTEDTHFVDCGGNPETFISQAGASPSYPDPHREYVEYVASQTTTKDRWALRDFPVTESVKSHFDMTVEELQRRTTDAHRTLLDMAQDEGINATPVTAIQGETIRDYLTHIDQLEAAGALTDTVAIGSIAFKSPDFKQEVILALREALSPSLDLHGFGVSLKTLRKDGVVEVLSSADSGGWLSQRTNTEHPAWDTDRAQALRPSLYEYLEYTKELGEIISTRQSQVAQTQSLDQYQPETHTIETQTNQLPSDTQRVVTAYKQGKIDDMQRTAQAQARSEQSNISAF